MSPKLLLVPQASSVSQKGDGKTYDHEKLKATLQSLHDQLVQTMTTFSPESVEKIELFDFLKVRIVQEHKRFIDLIGMLLNECHKLSNVPNLSEA